MQVVFKDDELEKFHNEKKNKFRFSRSIQRQFIIKVNLLKAANDTRAISALAGSLNFEKLKEKRYKGKYSIRINEQRRVIINKKDKPEITLILEEITDYH
ncbi:MAG: type II toxin-antitoxin system RelE/ParE family toxin [Candidatus Peribacteria bacterium]|jgi:proteic killer suppression protein|nr:type II toxin-antitoxin system RelE/ParE family toxin [Candidatus Peribacteria bacterium]